MYFTIENSERFILYSLCGCFLGITIILLSVIIVLYIENRQKIKEELGDVKNDYQVPRPDTEYNDIISSTRSYVPVYRFDARTHHEFYNV